MRKLAMSTANLKALCARQSLWAAQKSKLKKKTPYAQELHENITGMFNQNANKNQYRIIASLSPLADEHRAVTNPPHISPHPHTPVPVPVHPLTLL